MNLHFGVHNRFHFFIILFCFTGNAGSTTQLLTSYCAATGGALTAALGLNSLVKVNSESSNRAFITQFQSNSEHHEDVFDVDTGLTKMLNNLVLIK